MYIDVDTVHIIAPDGYANKMKPKRRRDADDDREEALSSGNKKAREPKCLVSSLAFLCM